MQQKVVSLVVETPLTEDDVCARLFAAAYLVFEILLLLVVELDIVLCVGEIDVVLRFRFGWLKGASQNEDFSLSKS